MQENNNKKTESVCPRLQDETTLPPKGIELAIYRLSVQCSADNQDGYICMCFHENKKMHQGESIASLYPQRLGPLQTKISYIPATSTSKLVVLTAPTLWLHWYPASEE